MVSPRKETPCHRAHIPSITARAGAACLGLVVAVLIAAVWLRIRHAAAHAADALVPWLVVVGLALVAAAVVVLAVRSVRFITRMKRNETKRNVMKLRLPRWLRHVPRARGVLFAGIT